MQARTLIYCGLAIWLLGCSGASSALASQATHANAPAHSTTTSMSSDASAKRQQPVPHSRIDRIVLKRTARIKPGQSLTLGDVAVIEGPNADELNTLVLIEKPEEEQVDTSGWFALPLDRVCDVLESRLGDQAASIDCSGTRCDVRILRVVKSSTRSVTTAASEQQVIQTADIYANQATVRGAIARELARILSVPTRNLRLVFEPRDASMLEISTTGRVVEVVPAGMSDRLPVSLAVYGPLGPILKETIRVQVELRREVAILSHDLPRGQTIDSASVSLVSRWISPSDSLADPAVVVGSIARRGLRTGEIITSRDIEPPIVIHRGDIVMVRVSSHSVVVSREARALADGKKGQDILFAAKKNPKEHFKATVVAPGEALIWNGTSAGTPLAIRSENHE